MAAFSVGNPVAVVAHAVHVHVQTHRDRILFPPFHVIKKLAATLELTLKQLQSHAVSLQIQDSDLKSNQEDLKLNYEATKRCIRNAMKQLVTAMVAWTQQTNESDNGDKHELLLVLCDLSKLCVQGFVQQSVSNGQLHISFEDLNMLLLVFGDLSKAAIIEETVNLMSSGKITFPWKRYYLENNLDEKFQKLKTYDPKITLNPLSHTMFISNVTMTQNLFFSFNFKGGSPCLIISSDNDYWDIDILTDYFTEKPRMQARRMLDKKSIMERWPDKALTTEMVRTALELDETKEHGLGTLSLRESLYKCANECTQFKASLAVTILRLLQSRRVLDISAGWGDRLLAAIALGLERYVGADPNTALKFGHDEMIKRFAAGFNRFKIIYAPFEDAALDDEKYDTIFTSPPFFDFEVYSNLPGQSVSFFKDQLSWTVDFLFMSLHKAWGHLLPTGYMAIHIVDVFKTKICEAMCLFCESKLEKCKYIGVVRISRKCKRKSSTDLGIPKVPRF